jgi:hypothetical protein
LAIALALRAWLVRRQTRAENLLGAIAPWVALSLVAAALVPGGSYLFAWPALFATTALAIEPRTDGASRAALWIGTALVSAPAPLLLAPVIVMLNQAITIGATPVSMALASLAVCLMVPPLDAASNRAGSPGPAVN